MKGCPHRGASLEPTRPPDGAKAAHDTRRADPKASELVVALGALLREAGLDSEAMLARARSGEIRAAYERNRSEAIAAGVLLRSTV